MSAVVTFLVVLVALKLLALLAPTLGLMAMPGGHRQHISPTPMVGGLAIFVGVLVATLIYQPDQIFLVLPAAMIVAVGVIDDQKGLPSIFRFAAQGLVIWCLSVSSGLQLTSLGDLLGQGSVGLAGWSMAVTVFAAIGVINAINMSDGLDGLAALLVVCSLFALFGFDTADTPLVATLLSALAAFLCFNLRLGGRRARAYLGDAGSTLLGFFLAYLLIQHSQGSDAAFKPVTALWLLALPLFDAVSVLLLRPIRGESPFAADRLHYHHLLLRCGLSANQTLAVCIGLQSLFIAFGLGMAQGGISEATQFFLFLLMFLLFLSLTGWFSRAISMADRPD